MSLAPYAESVVPLSDDIAILLLGETTVCTTESYEYRVYCTDVNGSEVGFFGRQGEGPGEFSDHLPDLLRGPDGTLGAIDSDLNRMTVFDVTSSAFVSQARLPGIYFQGGASSFSSTLTGSSWSMERDSAGAIRTTTQFAEMDLGSGEVVWERVYGNRFRTDAGCETYAVREGLSSGTFSLGGSAVFPLCRGQLLLFAARDDASGTLIRAPRYVLEYPSEPEVQEYLESAGGFAREEWFRSTPKPYQRLPLVFDDQNRLWVVTSRGRHEGVSYLDVYSGAQYWGAVQVRHDALAVDVLGSTLVVLVDRPVGPGDSDGYPDRGVDWYDISELEAPAYDPG
ncbi:MAG: hypothetical protein OXH08_05370 [Gammaproteobacteria bacterium]|nr:hypothetical protein [Gammaproteobacteria bacterium]MDE0650362.1 hypothetical protein [Gammaproteobacteria bacterium]